MNLKAFIAELRKNKFKVTPQRLAIYEIILNAKNHPTAEEIHRAIIKKFPRVSLTTIYKSLTLLKDLNFLQELNYNTRTRYDPNILPHINLVCPICNEIVDYESEYINTFMTQTVKDLRINPTGQRFDIYRTCEKCDKKIN